MSGKRWLLCTVVVAGMIESTAWGATQTLSLDAYADEASTYYEYYSDALIRLGLRGPGATQQRFHGISNPSVQYGGLDGFPNENNFRLGQLAYDDAGLVGGTGPAPITGLTLGIQTDPFDSSYRNFLRFNVETLVNSFAGTVQLINGVPAGIELNAEITLRGSNILNNVNPAVLADYAGTFTIDGGQFHVLVDDDPVFPTLFTTDQPVHLAWDFTGRILSVPEPATGSLLALGLGAIAVAKSRQRRRRQK